MEAQGQPWDTIGAAEAFALIRRRNCMEVRGEMAALCQRHRLPTSAEVLRHLAKEAARLEAEAAAFAWGVKE